MSRRVHTDLLLVALILSALVLLDCSMAQRAETPDGYGELGVGSTWTTQEVWTSDVGRRTFTKRFTILSKDEEEVTLRRERLLRDRVATETIKVPRAPAEPEADPHVRKLGSGTGTVTVPAGTFECDWVELRTATCGGTERRKVWTLRDAPGLTVMITAETRGPSPCTLRFELQSLTVR
jgi:hypothetical protein